MDRSLTKWQMTQGNGRKQDEEGNISSPLYITPSARRPSYLEGNAGDYKSIFKPQIQIQFSAYSKIVPMHSDTVPYSCNQLFCHERRLQLATICEPNV
jgi:hypothetical protein